MTDYVYLLPFLSRRKQNFSASCHLQGPLDRRDQPRTFLLNIHVLPCLCWIRNVDVFSYFTQSIPLCFRAPLLYFILANLPTGVRLVRNYFLLEKQLPRVGD